MEIVVGLVCIVMPAVATGFIGYVIGKRGRPRLVWGTDEQTKTNADGGDYQHATGVSDTTS